MEAPVHVATRTKKFIAPTLRQALDAMRKELGDDALLLATQSGINIDGMPYAEVVGMAGQRSGRTSTILTGAVGAPAPSQRSIVRIDSASEPIPLRYYIERGVDTTPDHATIEQLQENIHRLSAKLTAISHAIAYRYSAILPDPYRRLYEMLRNAGFAEQYAGFLVAQVASGENLPTIEQCLERLWSILTSLLPIERLFASSAPRIIAFSGPSGSGKTTTLMKVALSLRKAYPNRRLQVMATDSERIAAQEQLRSFSVIVGIEFTTAHTEADFAALPSDDITLVDLPPTSGRSSAKSTVLADAIVDAGGIVITTLPAPCDRDIARTLLEHIACRKHYYVALTKLDEAPRCGHLLPLFWEFDVPLSLVTTGTRLPDDLAEPSVDHLMQFLFSS